MAPRQKPTKPSESRAPATRGSGIASSVRNHFGLNHQVPERRTAAEQSSGDASSSKKAGSNGKSASSDSSKGRSDSERRASKAGVTIDGQSRWDVTRGMGDIRPFYRRPVGECTASSTRAQVRQPCRNIWHTGVAFVCIVSTLYRGSSGAPLCPEPPLGKAELEAFEF